MNNPGSSSTNWIQFWLQQLPELWLMAAHLPAYEKAAILNGEEIQAVTHS